MTPDLPRQWCPPGPDNRRLRKPWSGILPTAVGVISLAARNGDGQPITPPAEFQSRSGTTGNGRTNHYRPRHRATNAE